MSISQSVTKYRDYRNGKFILQWGGRKDRDYLHTRTKDAALAEELRKKKERELALASAGDYQNHLIEVAIAEAKRVAAITVEAAIKRGAATPSVDSGNGQSPPSMSVEKGLTEFLKAHTAAGNSETHIANIECQIRKYIKHSGIREFSDHSPQKLIAWLADTREVEKLGDKSVKDKHQIVTMWLEWVRDPQPIMPKAPPKKSIGFFGAEEYRKILAEADKESDDRKRVVTAMVLFGGFRREEVFRTTYEDIHIKEREIEVGEGVTTTKTRRPRSVPILDPLLPYLEDLPKGKGRLIGFWKSVCTLGAFYNDLVRRATGRGEGFRDSRHSAITWWVHSGLSLNVASEWAGDSPVIIQKNYLGRVPRKAEPVVMTFERRRLSLFDFPENLD